MTGEAERFENLVAEGSGRPTDETEQLIRLMRLFLELPPPPDPFDLMPRFVQLRNDFASAAEGSDGEALEEAFLELYCHVHGHEAPYTEDERRRVDQVGGYWCHAGGLSPILKAGPFISENTVSADFGAGNGLQGLLLQKLYPHRKTVQIEISSRMVKAGQRLQEWLEIPSCRVDWIIGDVLGTSSRGVDFIYLYRPVRPEGEGAKFYRKLASELAQSSRRVVIFSIADCLRDYLSPEYEVFYGDGHLTCFRRRGRRASQSVSRPDQAPI